MAILQLGLELIGHCIAILFNNLSTSERVKQSARVRALGKAGFHYTNQATKEVPVTLIGGVVVKIEALYRLARKRRNSSGRKRKRGRRGKSEGQGYYPLLDLLGIDNGASPLIRVIVSQAATQAPSFEQAKAFVNWLGLGFSTSRIRRISEAFTKTGLSVRDNLLERMEKGTLEPKNVLKGKRVVITVDGGRINIRNTHQGRRRKSGWHGYDASWREPRLLTIYVLDEEGDKIDSLEAPLVADGSLGSLDEFLTILQAHLYRLGIAQAEQIVLIGDGAPWIWNNIPDLLSELGCSSPQVTQILDTSHVVEYLYDFAEDIFKDPGKAKKWAAKWAKKLKKGQVKSLIGEIQRYLANGNVKDLDAVKTGYKYFQRHYIAGRLDYDDFKVQKLPTGSGVIESLIRQVINLRLKSSGKHWLEENAEAFIHARCQWAVHQWTEYCNNVLTFSLAPLT